MRYEVGSQVGGEVLAALPNGNVVGPLPPVDIGDSGRACVN